MTLNNSFIVFDILLGKIQSAYNLNLNPEVDKYVYEDDLGFSNLMLTTSSDVFFLEEK